MRKILLLSISAFVLCALSACKKNKTEVTTSASTEIYFPSSNNKDWQTISPNSLGWDNSQLEQLYPYLTSKNTKAFIILKDGKIVVEKYFGTFTADSSWYWASAGKTLTAFMVGIAQKEGILNINNKTSDYLGNGWTNAPLAKENLITVRNQLTMTTGLDESQPIKDCTLPYCLNYKVDAGTRWYYFNSGYTLLDAVIEKASGTDYNTFCKTRLKDKIGMTGLWIKKQDSNNVFYSNAKSMARFGLLLLNKGVWDDTPILNDQDFYKSQINSSQNLNPAYGFLTWLNGKSKYILPGTPISYDGVLIPNAPLDMFSALGKDDQKIYVVPSQNLVIIRMGESAGDPYDTVSRFDNELWAQIKKVIKF
ncbi:serine hydrolase [Pedobacter psychrophilus]|uniref:Serine hydrolase n=1 Tax=Pedobacter psychrophilus TaxID=1826909 RepID=A0A179DDD7_9SPHI|nr:serine hydrolase [Pedobacter psychrophilus]OAQ39046.1 serine hydrolase [Pedobacter psychrophilus]